MGDYFENFFDSEIKEIKKYLDVIKHYHDTGKCKIDEIFNSLYAFVRRLRYIKTMDSRFDDEKKKNDDKWPLLDLSALATKLERQKNDPGKLSSTFTEILKNLTSTVTEFNPKLNINEYTESFVYFAIDVGKALFRETFNTKKMLTKSLKPWKDEKSINDLQKEYNEKVCSDRLGWHVDSLYDIISGEEQNTKELISELNGRSDSLKVKKIKDVLVDAMKSSIKT